MMSELMAIAVSYIFASFCACYNLNRGLEIYVSYDETQHRNDELHFLLCFEFATSGGHFFSANLDKFASIKAIKITSLLKN